MSEKDGGAAFPRVAGGSISHSGIGSNRNIRFESVGGMSLRDYFAGHALAGLAAYVDLDSRHPEVAQLAYELADAMLKARDE